MMSFKYHFFVKFYEQIEFKVLVRCYDLIYLKN